MTQSQSLGDVIARGVELNYHEAVAVAQQLIASAERVKVNTPAAAPVSIDTVRISADGSVERDRSTTPPTVGDIGLLLETMLPQTGTVRVPGAVRYAMARALQRVDAPPFESLDALATTLLRHEQRPRDVVVQGIYARAAAAAPKVATVPTVAAASTAAASPEQPVGLERRRRSPSATVLRRQLREADEELFAHLSAQATRPHVQHPPAVTADADTYTYHPVMEAPTVAHPFKPGAWALAGALSVSVAFGAGYAFVSGRTAMRLNGDKSPSAVTQTASPAPAAGEHAAPRSDRRTMAKSEERDNRVPER